MNRYFRTMNDEAPKVSGHSPGQTKPRHLFSTTKCTLLLKLLAASCVMGGVGAATPPADPPPTNCGGCSEAIADPRAELARVKAEVQEVRQCSGCVSPSPPPPSPSPGCTGHTFADQASLRTAAIEYYSKAAAATAKYGPIGSWCVSGVTDMSWLFYNMYHFNADISGWDTSRVTDMSYMFYLATAFNQPLSWDTSRVTSMGYMFHYANALSAANKLRIRCAWAGTKAFASAGYGYSSWGPGSCD